MTKDAHSYGHVMEILWIWVKDVCWHRDKLLWPFELFLCRSYELWAHFRMKGHLFPRFPGKLSFPPNLGSQWWHVLIESFVVSFIIWARAGLRRGHWGFIRQHFLYYRQYMSSTSLMLTGIWLIHCHEGRFTPRKCLVKSFKLLRSEK